MESIRDKSTDASFTIEEIHGNDSEMLWRMLGEAVHFKLCVK